MFTLFCNEVHWGGMRRWGGGMFGKRDNRVQGSARVVEVHVFLKTYLVFLLLDGFLSSKRQVCLNLRVLQHSSFQTRANRDNQTSVQRHCGMRRSFSKVTSRGSGGDGGQNTTSSWLAFKTHQGSCHGLVYLRKLCHALDLLLHVTVLPLFFMSRYYQSPSICLCFLFL